MECVNSNSLLCLPRERPVAKVTSAGKTGIPGNYSGFLPNNFAVCNKRISLPSLRFTRQRRKFLLLGGMLILCRLFFRLSLSDSDSDNSADSCLPSREPPPGQKLPPANNKVFCSPDPIQCHFPLFWVPAWC